MSNSLRTLLLLTCFAAAARPAQPQAPATPTAALNQDFGAAEAALHAGNYTEATARLEKLELRAPKSFEVHELLGMAYGSQSQFEKSAEHLRLAASLRPNSAAAHTNLATALIHLNKPHDAEAEWRKALALDPHDYSANHNLAELYLQQNRIPDALPLLEAAQRIRPNAQDNGYDLALADLLSGRDNDARQRVQTLQARHDSGELHTLLGRLNEKQGKYVEAANEFAAAAHMDPSEDNLFVWATELLLHRAYQPAIDVFGQGTKLFPSSPRLWIGLGMALYSRGEYEPSIRALLTAADLNPRDPRCYLFLSKAYLSSPTQAEDVIARFRTYATLEPANARAQYYYAVSLWKGRRVENPDVDYNTVEALLQKSIALDGAQPEAHLQLGILYNDEHAYEKSLPEYERALQLDPNLADAHFRLGRYYLHAGEKAKAQTEFDTFKTLQAQHQAQIDKERADVQQFVVSTQPAPPTQP